MSRFARSRRLAGAVLSIAMIGCATPAATGSNGPPRDLSAAEHRDAAAEHEAAARALETGSGAGAGGPNADGPWSIDGPFRLDEASRLSAAQRARAHRLHAEQHRAVAGGLEGAEDSECRDVALAVRPVCPLVASVVRIEGTEYGVRLHLVAGANAAAVIAHMRCHHAFGRSHGFEHMAACPLYVRGIRIRQVSPETIDIDAPDLAAAEEVRRRAGTHVVLGPESDAGTTGAGTE